ncbi:MAG: SIR2 family protein [Gammaproteobacteria bacterium]|nr:SIR2 family protein [Gammaproteobacteria bacterium]
MSEFDYQKQAQDYYSKAPTIILGSGASVSFGISGMGDLARHLLDSIDVSRSEPEEQKVWQQFGELLANKVDLESALHQIRLPPNLAKNVITTTWKLINSEDLFIYHQAICDQNHFALGHLLSALFKSTLQEINIITTNYDRLAEYACEQEALYHYTGYSNGFTRRLVDQSLHRGRQVNIWKVHGSLDWYSAPSGEILGLPNLSEIPNDFDPQIVTPGIEKYLKTHIPPFRDIVTNSDRVLQKSLSYLCVGFGFNDDHIQPKLIQKCVREKTSIVVVTYELTEAAKKLLFENNIQNYLAIERGDHDDQSRIYSSLNKAPIIVDKNYWTLEGYLNLIL